jgi:hypothetical protein
MRNGAPPNRWRTGSPRPETQFGSAFAEAVHVASTGLPVSFEDLVGEQGGGSRDRQHDAVNRILTFLEVDADPAAVAEKIFNRRSFTFRQGRIGRWQRHFTPRHLELFEARYGRLLDLYGYR